LCLNLSFYLSLSGSCLLNEVFSKDDVSAEAFKALYGTSRKNDIDLSKKNKIVTPVFPDIVSYVFSESEILVRDTSKRFTIGNHILPFSLRTYVEVCPKSAWDSK
jgi:hypothetical protein